MNEMRKLAHHTKAKKRAASSHNKLNKLAKQQANDDQLQRRSLALTKPKKMLQIAIKNTKDSLKVLKFSHLLQPLEDTDSIVAPQAKRQKPSSGETTSVNKRKAIYDEIRLPRPLNGRIVYNPTEAVNAIVSVCEQNLRHPRQTFIALVKERMINDGRVPVKQAQLNVLIKDMGDGKSLPMFWNARGAPEIVPLHSRIRYGI